MSGKVELKKVNSISTSMGEVVIIHEDIRNVGQFVDIGIGKEEVDSSNVVFGQGTRDLRECY